MALIQRHIPGIRAIEVGDWPYVWLDATYVKVRQAGRIVSVAVIIAVGVNSGGRLRGVKLVISDAHEGLKAAIAGSVTPRAMAWLVARGQLS